MDHVVPSLPKPSGDANLYMPDRWLFNYSDPCVKPREQVAREVKFRREWLAAHHGEAAAP
jgi:hypothetical protein